MLNKLSLIATAFFMGLLASQSIAVAEGSDGVELEIVPVGAGVECSSIILKGTRRFEGTAFVMPRVLVGITKENEDLFQVIPDNKGGYLLSIGLYFPGAGESTTLRAGRSNLYLHGCNFETALHQINTDIPAGKPKVTRLARLPVRNIEVIIDGVKDRAVIGEVASKEKPDETSILNYEGTDHTVEFELSESEKEGLLRRLERKQGISIKVNMKFSARTNDGSLYAEVDLESLAANLQANLDGKYMVASGELKSAISNALANTRISITTEAGKGQLFEKIAENLMTLVLANVTDVTAAPAPTTAPAPAAPAASAAPATADSGVSAPRIKVDTVLSLLRSQKKRVVSYSNTSALQTHVYTTPVNFQARLQDPDLHEVYVRSGDKITTVPGQINAGDRVTIAVSRAYVESIDYRPKTSYLTANEVTRLGLQEYYPMLLDERFVLHNEDTKLGYFAIGKAREWSFLTWRTYFFDMNGAPTLGLDRYARQRYLWMRTEWIPSYASKTQVLAPTITAVRNLALQVTFSKVGTRRFNLADLVQDNDYWTAQFDELGGKIELKAKRELGYLMISGYAPTKREKRVMDQVQLEIREIDKSPVREAPKRTREKVVPLERLAYTILVGRPDADFVSSHSTRRPTPLSEPTGPAASPSGASIVEDSAELEMP